MTRDRLTALLEHPRGDVAEAAPCATGPETLAPADVTVIYGSRTQAFGLAGMAVSHAVDVVAPILGVEAGRPALVNGRPVPAGHRLAEGDTLELVRVAGEKG